MMLRDNSRSSVAAAASATTQCCQLPRRRSQISELSGRMADLSGTSAFRTSLSINLSARHVDLSASRAGRAGLGRCSARQYTLSLHLCCILLVTVHALLASALVS